MSYKLTGNHVSDTYIRLVQCVSGNYYDGAGNPLNITDTSLLNSILANYISEASLNSTQFFWNAGILDISVGSSASDVTKSYVDSSLALRDASINWLSVNKSASTHNHDGRYVKEASLGSEFFWSGGMVHVDVSVVAGGVTQVYVDGSLALRDSSINWLVSNRLDPSLDYATYEPMVSNVSFNCTGELITQIITTNILGTKTVDFIYDANDDISVININNYGKWLRTITFEKDVNENITAIHIA